MVYKFDELSEEAKQKVIEGLADINVDCNWFEFIYEDANNVGLKINGFDIDRRSYCNLEFTKGAENCADLIIANHGEACDTYNTAKKFLEDRTELVKKYSDGVDIERVYEGNIYELDFELDELEEDFLKSLSEDYLSMLKEEYEYKTSEEAIVETIKTNDYEFTDNGKLI